MTIRPATADDRDRIQRVHQAAFPDGEWEKVAKLADDLLLDDSAAEILSLVAEIDDDVIGHVAFSPVTVANDSSIRCSILAPLAVVPNAHGSGIGNALVTHGLDLLAAEKTDVVLVYGDPKYYGRFGFVTEAAENFQPPYPLEFPFGWQALVLGKSSLPDTAVEISCVEPLCDPTIW